MSNNVSRNDSEGRVIGQDENPGRRQATEISIQGAAEDTDPTTLVQEIRAVLVNFGKLRLLEQVVPALREPQELLYARAHPRQPQSTT